MSYSMSIDMDRSDDADSADLAAQTGGIYAQVRYGVDEDERTERLAAGRPPDEEDDDDYDDEMDEDDYDDEELDGALLEEGIPFYMSETDETYAYEVDEDDEDDDEFIVEEEQEHDDEEEDDEEEYSDDSDGELGQRVYLSFLTTNGRRSVQPRRNVMASQLDPVPNPKGAELANSGEFGYVESKEYQIKSRRKYPHSLGDRLFRRETSFVKYPSSTFCRNFVPNHTSKNFLHYHARTYSGQFSEDGSFFFTASQDFKVRLYDTTQNFPWRLYKTVRADMAHWTVTDASLSRDNKWIAYSSISPVVHLASTSPEVEGQEPLDFSAGGYNDIHRSYGIWSIRFSADGREIVAGAGDSCMYVYDIETRRVLLQLEGHTDDVNAVCFGDESGNILYSGSDDQLIKVWDRRSLRSKQEAGVLLGHVEGITYIDSKKDGRYLLSNGKDQTMKLWDIRKLVSADKFRDMEPKDYSTRFDYRYQRFPGPVGSRHPNDCSVMTYTGHQVLRTLIRCHFAPPSTSGSQYVYSGSSDGKVHIWSLDGQVKNIIDVSAASGNNAAFHTDARERYYRLGLRFTGGGDSVACVRDASWHPYLPIIASSAWNGYSAEEGSVMLHQWLEGVEQESCPEAKRVPMTLDVQDDDYDQDDYF
ncbi:WD40-repeat-containing domain protein [Lipomyces doorenjongii]|uniref:WD40-repeat-containing domain protein n=1 Tax=Lipomyces doorenjongii TaxID=383834 RepID=UPI0034CE80AA